MATVAFSSQSEVVIGQADLNWSELGFRHTPVRGFARSIWRDGEWGEVEFCEGGALEMDIMSGALHYGLSIFEGLKAFHWESGKVMVFRDDMNHVRLTQGAERLLMQAPPLDLFRQVIDRSIRENRAYIPPFGSGGSLYVRPILFASGAVLGVEVPAEFTFAVVVCPVGPYYKTPQTASPPLHTTATTDLIGREETSASVAVSCGTPVSAVAPFEGVRAVVVEDFDPAAPLGTGRIKMGGNYAASMLPGKVAKQQGFAITLYLDPVEHEYVEEFNTSNFLGVTKSGEVVTPLAPDTVLASITCDSLLMLAERILGLKVTRRRVHFNTEIYSFAEVGAVGTAVIVTPLQSVTRGGKTHCFQSDKTLQKLKHVLTEMQCGLRHDTFAWMRAVPMA